MLNASRIPLQNKNMLKFEYLLTLGRLKDDDIRVSFQGYFFYTLLLRKMSYATKIYLQPKICWKAG